MYRLICVSILTLALSACSHVRLGSYFQESYDESSQQWIQLRPCSLPFVVDTDGLSERDRQAVQSAIDYWNGAIERRIFVTGDRSFDSPVVSIRYPAESIYSDNAAVAFPHISSRCITGALVVLIHPLDSYPEWSQQRILRHELGHALGLDDSSKKWHLMYGSLDTLSSPELSEGEVKATKGELP
jgi:hypothetical protein